MCVKLVNLFVLLVFVVWPLLQVAGLLLVMICRDIFT